MRMKPNKRTISGRARMPTLSDKVAERDLFLREHGNSAAVGYQRGLAMSNWRDLAKAAEDARGKAKHGQREIAIGLVAPDTDVAVIRRKMRVAKFLDEVAKKDAREARSLRSTSFSLLQIIARWADLDWDAALQAVEKMKSERQSVRKLQHEFDIFRGQVGSTELPKRLMPTAALLNVIANMLGGKVSEPRTRPKVLGARFVDFSVTLDRAGFKHRIGVMLVGPYSDPRLYKKRMQSALLTAWAAAWACDEIVLVLPVEAPIEAYRRRLIDAQADIGDKSHRAPVVHLLPMEASFYSPALATKAARDNRVAKSKK